jgi:hypothetical protein
MDETSLYWKRTPNRTFAIQSYSRTKKSKDCITIALTSNANSNKKFLLWIISKLENL